MRLGSLIAIGIILSGNLILGFTHALAAKQKGFSHRLFSWVGFAPSVAGLIFVVMAVITGIYIGVTTW